MPGEIAAPPPSHLLPRVAVTAAAKTTSETGQKTARRRTTRQDPQDEAGPGDPQDSGQDPGSRDQDPGSRQKTGDGGWSAGHVQDPAEQGQIWIQSALRDLTLPFVHNTDYIILFR